jgi:hypothetical protein
LFFSDQETSTLKEDNSIQVLFLVLEKKLADKSNVAELHHFYAAPAPGKIFDAARRLHLRF